MSSQSITNKLIANIKQTSSSNITTITNQKVICIDSSKNAIGINTLNPIKALTISGGDNSFNAVYAPYLYITNSGIIEELSTNFLFANDASINDLSLINADFSYINGLKADISNLDVSFINIKSEFLRVETISCDDLSVNILDVINTIDCSLGKFKEIQTDKINLGQDIKVKEIDVSYLYVSICGDISFIICNTISANNISCGFLDVTQILDVSSINANSIDIANSLTIQQDLSVNGNTLLNTITANNIQIGTTPIENFIQDTTQNLFADGTQDVSFNNVNIKTLYMTNSSNTSINLNSNTSITSGSFIPSNLVIPGVPANNQNTNNYIYFDSTNKLHIGSQSIAFTSNIIYLTCDNDISGQRTNDFSFNTAENNYEVYNYNNLKIEKPNNLLNNDNKYNSYSFKFIPLKSDSTVFTIDDSSKSYLQINTSNVNTFELYANVSFKFYNKIAHDVELNNYIFGVCDISNGDKLYTSIQNSIMVFDNSFNYANSSINYYGTFDNNTSNNSRLQFFVGSVKDNSFIYIDSLSAIIKF